LNLKGHVVGVQRLGIAGESHLNFCIPHKHIARLKFDKDPQPFPGTALQSNLPDVLNSHSDSRAVARSQGREFDVGCYHWGEVSKDPQVVFQEFIGDKSNFARMIPVGLLGQILARNAVIHVTNPSFRFGVLVPRSYQLRQEPLANPLGLRVTLISDEAGLPPELTRLTITAWRIPSPPSGGAKPNPEPPSADALREVLRQGALIRQADGPRQLPGRDAPLPRFPGTPAQPPAPGVPPGGGERAWLDHFTRTLAGGYPYYTLGLQALSPGVIRMDAPRSQVEWDSFRSDHGPILHPTRQTARVRAVYHAARPFNRSHVVYLCVNEDSCVVADFEFVTDQLFALERSAPVRRDLVERLFMAASLSFY
jgi:hypothetical protein